MPADVLRDLEHGRRQEAFRQSLRDSGLTVQLFRNPDHLGRLVERSLRRLAGDVGATGVGGDGNDRHSEGRVLRQSRPVPVLLPYLPDRHQQEQAMGQALRRLMAAEQARPLVVILHGDDDQRVERFRDRFFGHTVATQFEGSLPVRDFHLPWPAGLEAGEGFGERFLEWIGHHVLGIRAAPVQLQALASQSAGPVVLWSSISTEEWGAEGAKLVEQVCRFWRESEPLAGQRLIHWISIRYLKAPVYVRRSLLLHWLWDCWRHRRRCRRRQRLNDQIRRCLMAMNGAPASDSALVVLPELQSVILDDAEGWVRSQPVRAFLRDQGLLPLEDEVRRFYRRWDRERGEPRIPLEELASFLHDQLRAASIR